MSGSGTLLILNPNLPIYERYFIHRPRLEQALKASKTTFEELLRNPPPSPGDAELIRKATREVTVEY
jgi:hypothetical protein